MFCTCCSGAMGAAATGMAEATECYGFGDQIDCYFPCACIGREKLKIQVLF